MSGTLSSWLIIDAQSVPADSTYAWKNGCYSDGGGERSSDASRVAAQMETGIQGTSHTGSVWKEQGRTLELPTGGPPCRHISLLFLVHPIKMTSAGAGEVMG